MNSEPIKSAFQQWTLAELRKVFGLQKTLDMPVLDAWVAAEHPIPENFLPAIEWHRRSLQANFERWNEIELRTDFIGPILALVGFQGEEYSAFSGRNLSGRVNDHEISGEVDWMAATGWGIPETPLFFLHEYKKNIPGSADPTAQLLSTMLVAQTLNGDEHPMYGCLVVGRIWSFCVLKGNRYGVSVSFDATDPTELPGIWSVLQETKNRIVKRVAELQAEGKA
mgnify:CR=1 FL=1